MSNRDDNVARPSKAGKYLDAETWEAMKSAGYTEDELLADQPTGPLISCYTRAEAIADGVLVDVTRQAKRLGFTAPVAVTVGALCEMSDSVVRCLRAAGQQPRPDSEIVQLTAIVSMLGACRKAAESERKAGRQSDRLHFRVLGKGDPQGTEIALWCLCGPGDDGEAVLTIMLEGED